MVRSKAQILLRLFAAVFVLGLASAAFGQLDDPDPNSPTPVLLKAKNSKRVYAVPADDQQRASMTTPSRDAFPPNSRIAIFVQNIGLMDGEGANAFRVYIEDAVGHDFRFPVVDAYQVKAKGVPTYALVVELRDEIGYWEPPADGDVLIRVAWRGLTTDRGRLGYGAAGGNIKDDAVPFSQNYARTAPDDTPGAQRPSSPEYVGYRWSGDRHCCNPRHSGKGIVRLRNAGVNVRQGILADECAQINEAFNKWIVTGRPFVIAKVWDVA